MEFKYQSDNIDKILPKFSKVQYAMRTGLLKESNGKHGEKSPYVKLEHLLFFCYGILEQEKLTLRLYQIKDETRVYLCASIIEDELFQFFSTYHFLYSAEDVGLDAQMKIGGDNTYASRYAIKTLFGIPMFDRNDPEHGAIEQQSNNTQLKQNNYGPEELEGYITKEQQDELFAEGGYLKGSMIELLAEMKQKKVISIAHSKYISANHFKAALTKIKEIKEKNGN